MKFKIFSGRDQGNAATRPGMPKVARKPRGARRDVRNSLPYSPQHLDLRLPASRTVRRFISAVKPPTLRNFVRAALANS